MSIKNDVKKSARVHNDSGRSFTKKKVSTNGTDGLSKPLMISDESMGPIVSDGFDDSTPVGKYGYFKGINDHYVSCENGMAPMTCNRENPGEWELFFIQDNGDGTVSIKGSNGGYVSRNEGHFMACDRSAVNGWERFNWINNGDNTYSLQGDNGKYVSFTYQDMTCNADSIGDYERFRWVPAASQLSVQSPTPTAGPGASQQISDTMPMSQASMIGSGKYWWLWYLIAAIAIILYLKYGRK